MAKRLTHFLKIFGICFGAFVGVIGVYLGIVWLITGFRPEVIELTGLRFSQEEYFFSDKDNNGKDVESITVMVLSNPEDTTQKQVTISFVNGMGHDVVELPIAAGEHECVVNVNEPIPLKLIRNANNDVIGGQVTLKAIGVEKDDKIAICNIYLDTPITSFDVKVTNSKSGAEVVTGESELASKIYPGDTMAITVDNSSVFPENSRQPFKNIYAEQVKNGVKEEDRIRNDEKRVYWESTDTTRATVDLNGNISILPTAAPGTVKIIARIYRTYELQDSHKTLFDFEYDVTIDPSNATAEYESYLERITAITEITIKILNIDVDNITSKPTSINGFHYTVGVNEDLTLYLDGDSVNSLGISINPADSVTNQFTSEDLRYKLSRIFVVPSYAEGGIAGYANGNNCLKISTISGNLDTGYKFTITALYPQSFVEKGTCLIIGLGVWDDETGGLKKNPDGTYVVETDIDGNEINLLTVYVEITTKEAEQLAIASSEEKYDNIDKIGNQNVSVDIQGSVQLDAYLRYTNKDGKKVTVNGKAGKLTNEITYSMVAFFVPAGTEIIDYDKSYGDHTYGIDLGQMWYPIGTSPILDSYNQSVLEANSVLRNFKGVGEITVIAVLLRTDINGRVLLVDENHARPTDSEGNIIDPDRYEEFSESMQLYYDFTIKSGTQDITGSGNVNNFTVTVTEDFDLSRLTISHRYGEMQYEELSAENGNLNQVYINDGSSEDYVYILVHYEDEGLASGEKGVITSAYTLGNFVIRSADPFNIVAQGLTTDGMSIDNQSGTDVLYIMGKMGTTTQPIVVTFVLNGEIIFSYNVSITNKLVEKVYLSTNAITEETDKNDVEKITVTVSPSDQNSNANWTVRSYNHETSSTTNLPLEISALFSYLGAEENRIPINEEYDISVYYSISASYDGEYGTLVRRGAKNIATLDNNNRYYLTSKGQPDNDYYGTISFFSSGTIYLKATISPYGTEIPSETIYQINIVVDEENWTFNKQTSGSKEYLELEMPLINNSGVLGESKYAKIALDSSEIGGMTGTYAQLYDTDPSSLSNDVTTLLIDLSKFINVTYNGTLLGLSSSIEHTKFLTFDIQSYNIYSPATGTYDISKDITYNKAEIFYDQELEVYFLRIKAINFNTRINLKISTYFGISDTYTILVTAPLTSSINSGFNEINQEYVAKDIEFDLLTRLNISTTGYIYNNEWIGNVDLSDNSFKTYITSLLTNVGIANQTNNNDLKNYIETRSTTIRVVLDTDDMISFMINMVFDLDSSIPSGTLTSQETNWSTYYYVRLIPLTKLEPNYTGNVYSYNGITYRNLFIGQTYNFAETGYVQWLKLKLNGTESVVVDLKGNPVYEDKTDEISLKFDSTSYVPSSNGYELYDSKGTRIATIKRNEKNYYNILEIEAGVFDGITSPNALLTALQIDSGVKTESYNIRINPLNIIVTTTSSIETYVGTTYDLYDSVTITSPTNNNNLQGLKITFELPDIIDSIDNKPDITIDENGVVRIIPITYRDSEGNEITLYPSNNFNFDVIVKVGKLTRTVTFICGRITASYDTSRTYTAKDIMETTGKDVTFVSMLEGSVMSVDSIVRLRSSILESGSTDITREISFSNFMIKESRPNFVLYDNDRAVEISSLNLSLQRSNDIYYIYYNKQVLLSLNAITGNIETTTYLPDGYSLYVYITCVYNSSYTYNLPIRVNSIIFKSTIESNDEVNMSKDADGNITIYLVSTVDDNTGLGTLSGDFVSAVSNKFVDASDTNTGAIDAEGNIILDLSFALGELDNVIIININNINHIYGYDANGQQREICQITPLGEITVVERLADYYEFNLRVMYQFENATSVHHITSYKIVILPEYSLEQRDNSLSYTMDDPYEVRLADGTSINLLSATDGVLILKHVRYNGNKIVFASGNVSYEIVDNVSPIIITTEFNYSLVDENDPNRGTVASECTIAGNILYLPVSINSDVMIKVTATVTISNSQTTEYDYYFLIKAGVEFELNLNTAHSNVIEGERFYNVTTNGVETYDSNTLVLDFDDVFSLKGDWTNISGYSIIINAAYLTDYMGNTLTGDGIRLTDNIIHLTNGSSDLATISYISDYLSKRLTTTYAMQKEVYIKLTIRVDYRTGSVEFKLNLRLMPKVIVASIAQNTAIPVIAGETFRFNNYITITELNATTFTYGAMSVDLLTQFIRNIKFTVGDDGNEYSYNDSYSTDSAITSLVTENVDILLANNLARITLFSYTLKIYPVYEFRLDTDNINGDGEVELFEGQTAIIPGNYLYVYSVKYNGTTFEQLNGVPVYVINNEQTDKVTVEVDTKYSKYAQSIENVKVYIRTYSTEVIIITAKLDVGGKYITYDVPVRAMDIKVSLEKFDNKDITEKNRIILPAGTNEQAMMKSRLTDDSKLYFYNLYYVQNGVTSLLYYNTSSTYHRLVISDISSKTNKYIQRSGTENVVEHIDNSNIFISFANNQLTVSGRLTEEVNVTVLIYIGDVADNEHILYFTFYPVTMEEVVTESYINNSGDNLQILAYDSGASILINKYLQISSEYTIDDFVYKPDYDFTNRVSFSFPAYAASGAFRQSVNGTADIITLTSLDDRKVTLMLIEDGEGTKLVLDEKLWLTSIQEIELTILAKIGLLETRLKFYISPVAFKYNYAYRASDGSDYYYHSTYIAYAYDMNNPTLVSNNVSLSELLLGSNNSDVTLELASANIPNNTLKVTNQNPKTLNDSAYMGYIYDCVGYVTDKDGIYYAYMKYSGGKYDLMFNIKMKTIEIDKVKYTVPVISETLDIYIKMTKGSIERTIHLEILPYIQMQTSMNDTYERVDNNGTPEDPTDDIVVNYDYYLSGNTYTLDYFYDYMLISCYDDSSVLVKDIRNTILTRVSLTSSVGVTYTVTSYEKYELVSRDVDGNYIEQPLESGTSLPNSPDITFVDGTLSISGTIDYVVYLIIRGRASTGYESLFYMKIIPNVLFRSIEEENSSANKTTSGDKFEFEKIKDDNEEFLKTAKKAEARISSMDGNNKEIKIQYSINVDTPDGTITRTYETKLDCYTEILYIGATIQIAYNPSDPYQVVLTGFTETLATITSISGSTVGVSYDVVSGTEIAPFNSSFEYDNIKLIVGTKIIVKYNNLHPTLIRYVGYLKDSAQFTDTNSVETILTGNEYDLKDYLSAYTPSVQTNKIQEYLDESTSTWFTVYADKTLDYKINYAWYYSSLVDSTGKPVALMASISPNGNIIIDGEEVVTIDDGILYASSNLTFDIYLNIEGSYKYNAAITYTKSFYLRIVPAMKFFLYDTATEQEYEVASGNSVLPIESASDTNIEQLDDGTRIIKLSKYIKARKIVSEDGVIQINGAIVSYSNQVAISYELNAVEVYSILSSSSTAQGTLASEILLAQNGVTFENGIFTLEKIYNTTCDISLTITAVIDNIEFTLDVLVQLYRESLIEVNYTDKYVQDETITYETIVSGSASGTKYRNSINFNSSAYLNPYVWSSEESKYVEAKISSTVTISTVSMCKSNSPAGPDKTSIQNNIVTVNKDSGIITAKNEIMGDYYFTIQLKLFYNGKYNTYTFYFRVLGRYILETSQLKNTYIDSEKIVYNQLLEPTRTEADGDKPIYASLNIMTANRFNSDGMILITTRTVETTGIITTNNSLTYLNGLVLQNSKVETASGVWDSTAPNENQFTFTYTNPTSSNAGKISLSFNDEYYTSRKITKKDLYITLNFTFFYSNDVFSDIYSIQYEIMFVPNVK